MVPATAAGRGGREREGGAWNGQCGATVNGGGRAEPGMADARRGCERGRESGACNGQRARVDGGGRTVLAIVAINSNKLPVPEQDR